MKKILFLFPVLFLLASCKKDPVNPGPATPANVPTYFSFNGNIASYDNAAIVSADNNLIMCGSWTHDIALLKVSKTGTPVWRKDFNVGGNSSVYGVAESTGQELFLCGNISRNYANTNYDILVIKTNSAGDTIWTKTYGGPDADRGYQVISTSDGKLLICGKTESFGAGSFGDIYLVKINLNGDTIWTNSFPDQDQEVPFHLMETQNGEFLVTATNEDNSNPRELYLLKVSATGAQLWEQKIGPATWKWGFSSIELSNGDLLTAGSHSSSQGYTQVLLVKTDHLGNVIWEREYGDAILSEEGFSIKQNADGTFSITGRSYDVSTMLSSSILLKVDQNGNQLFLNYFGTSSSIGANCLTKDTNDDNIITGNYNGSIFVTKTDNNGIFR